MADQELSCSDCGDTFPFRETEQAFFRERNLTPPKRCRACRDKRKASSASPGGGDRGGGPPQHARPRPGARPDARRAGASPGPGGPRPGARASAAAGPGGPRGPRPPRDDRPRYDPRDRKAPAAPAADAAPRAQWGRPQPAFARADGAASDRKAPAPARAGRVVEAAPRRPVRTVAASTEPEAPRPPRDPKNPRDGGRAAAAVREDKPRFSITCQECGTQADVPFKPIDGRQIFCQPCYRARKGTVATATDGASIDTNDAGIIE